MKNWTDKLSNLITNLPNLIKNIIFKERDFTIKIIFLITIAFLFFLGAFIYIVSVSGNKDLLILSPSNLKVKNVISFLSKLSILNFFISSILNISLTPNNHQILVLLITTYFFLIFSILLGFLIKRLMFPLIAILSFLWLLILNFTKNYVFENPVLLNFRGIKLVRPLTDQQRLNYVNDYYHQYLHSLELKNKCLSKKFILENFYNQISIENDPTIIKNSLIKYMDNFSEVVLSDQRIKDNISILLDSLTNKTYNHLINPDILILEIHKNGLKGHIEIIEFFKIRILELASGSHQNTINNKNTDLWLSLNQFIPSTETLIKVTLSFLLIGTVCFVGYMAYNSSIWQNVIDQGKQNINMANSNMKNLENTTSMVEKLSKSINQTNEIAISTNNNMGEFTKLVESQLARQSSHCEFNNNSLATKLLRQQEIIEKILEKIEPFSETAEAVKNINSVLTDTIVEVNDFKKEINNGLIVKHNTLDILINNTILSAINNIANRIDRIEEIINNNRDN